MKMLVGLLAALALAGPAAGATVEARDLEAKLRTPFVIACRDDADWPYPEAGGYALLASRTVVLRSVWCDELRAGSSNILFDGALFVVLHELAHVGWQSTNEEAANCFALFTIRWYARHMFGLPAVVAERIYQSAWQLNLESPPQYRGCPYMPRDPLRG